MLRWALFLGAAVVGLKGLSREPVVRAGNTVRDPEREYELPRALLELFGSLLLTSVLREQAFALDLVLPHRMVPRPLLAPTGA